MLKNLSSKYITGRNNSGKEIGVKFNDTDSQNIGTLWNIRRFWYLFVVGVVGRRGWLLRSIGDYPDFRIWLLFSSSDPINLSSSLSLEGCKRIKVEKKQTRIPFSSELYFGVHDYSMTANVFIISRSSRVSLTRYWKIFVSFFDAKKLTIIVCPVGVSSEVFLEEAVANRIHNLPQSPGLNEHVCYSARSREKQVLPVEVIAAFWKYFSFGTKKYIFQACMDFTSCQRASGKTLLFNLFILSFYFFFFQISTT